MKILIVHNDYGKYSGEEAVVDKMVAMFGGHGHEVALLRMTTAGKRETLSGKISGFLSGIYSRGGVRAMREALRREKPDVVNVHNLYPFISPAALFECRKAGVPVVMTVHNYRLVCPTGLFMRENKPCEWCLKMGNEWSCVRYNCEQSMLKSVGYAARNAVARMTGAYKKNVSVYACLTSFQREKLIEAGFDGSKIMVVPNSVDTDSDEGMSRDPKSPCRDSAAGDYVGYCGRLSREKGVDLIVEVARRHPEVTFRLAGALRDPELVENLPDNVRLTGHLSGEALRDFYRNAKFFVMASRWYEGFPMSILEAAQYSKAMVAPDHGGFSEIIGRDADAVGRLFAPGDTDGLERQIVDLWNDAAETNLLGAKAFEKLRREYSSDVVYQKWLRLLNDIR